MHFTVMAKPPPDPRYILRNNVSAGIQCAAFLLNSNCEYICAGTDNGYLILWNLSTLRQGLCVKLDEESCQSVQTTTDNNIILQQKSGLYNIYKFTESQAVLEKSIKTQIYHYCKFQKKSECEIYVPLSGACTGLFSLNTMKMELVLNPSSMLKGKNVGEAMAINPILGTDLILTVHDGKMLFLWDIRQKRIISELDMPLDPLAMDFSCEKRMGVVGGPETNLQVFNVSEDEKLSKLKTFEVRNRGTATVKFRPDSKLIAIGGWDGRVRIFTSKTLKKLAVLDVQQATVNDIIFSPCLIKSLGTPILASGSKDGSIALWDIYN